MAMTKAEPKEEIKPKTLYQKLQAIHASAKYVQKSQQSTQYTYAGSSDVLGQIHELMDQEGVLLIPRITGKNVMTSSNKKGAVVYFTELIDCIGLLKYSAGNFIFIAELKGFKIGGTVL